MFPPLVAQSGGGRGPTHYLIKFATSIREGKRWRCRSTAPQEKPTLVMGLGRGLPMPLAALDGAGLAPADPRRPEGRVWRGRLTDGREVAVKLAARSDQTQAADTARDRLAVEAQVLAQLRPRGAPVPELIAAEPGVLVTEWCAGATLDDWSQRLSPAARRRRSRLPDGACSGSKRHSRNCRVRPRRASGDGRRGWRHADGSSAPRVRWRSGSRASGQCHVVRSAPLPTSGRCSGRSSRRVGSHSGRLT